MLFVIDNTAVEMTVEELLDIVERDKFDEFFDFLMECEEEASMMTEMKAWAELGNLAGEAEWKKLEEGLSMMYGGKEIMLTNEQQEEVVNGLTHKGDPDGDIPFQNMSEDDIVKYILGQTPPDQQDDGADIEERIREVMRRLK